ncbi:MAG: uracil-DNA glycosylase [Oscillospiraceae bacterium]|jgi:uracil-DNA glycosylase|nr:uracil-DNA glycosylase [Oscillospiraceae bacterium]
MTVFNNAWDEFFARETRKEYYLKLRKFLINEYNTKKIYPAANNIYAAFKATPPENVKAVILGQDPYHAPGQAHGLAFSVISGVRPPPSLVNISRELFADLGCNLSDSCLLPWANQGVFLLNTCLTVIAGQANSHRGIGWETLTDSVISHLNMLTDYPKVFLLWGNNAKAKRKLITNPQHLILEAAHPSPLSAHNGFFGCKHFSRTNEFLNSRGIPQIDWKF